MPHCHDATRNDTMNSYELVVTIDTGEPCADRGQPVLELGHLRDQVTVGRREGRAARDDDCRRIRPAQHRRVWLWL